MEIVAKNAVVCSNKKCGYIYKYKESDIERSYGIMPFSSFRFTRPRYLVVKEGIVKCPVCGENHTVDSWLEYNSEILHLKDDVNRVATIAFVMSILSLIACIAALLN